MQKNNNQRRLQIQIPNMWSVFYFASRFYLKDNTTTASAQQIGVVIKDRIYMECSCKVEFKLDDLAKTNKKRGFGEFNANN